MTQADLIAWRDRLIQARVSGARRVRDSDGSEVEYKSDSELARALGYVESLMRQPAVKTLKFYTSKGV